MVWFSVMLILVPHGQHTEGPLQTKVLMWGILQLKWDAQSSCSALSLCEFDNLGQYGEMIDSIPINTDFPLNTTVTKLCVSFRHSASDIKPSGNTSGSKHFWCAIAAPSSSSVQKEKGQRFPSLTLVNTGRQHVIKQLSVFPAVYKILAFRISPCAVLRELSSWHCSCCVLLDSLGSMDEGLLFISCTSKRDKDKEIREARFFPHVPG